MPSEPSTSEQRDGHLAPRRNADYFYDAVIGNFVYGEGHPMRPHRVRLVHHLVVNYGLYKHLNVFRPKAATKADMRVFHSDEYVDFLESISPDSMNSFVHQLDRYNLCADCPVFDGLFEYCQTYVGGSISGAAPFFFRLPLPAEVSAGSTSMSSHPSETTGSSNCEIW